MSENLGGRFCLKTWGEDSVPKLGAKILPKNFGKVFSKKSKDSRPKLEGESLQKILHSSALQVIGENLGENDNEAATECNLP